MKGIDIVTQIHNEVEVLSKLQGYPGISIETNLLSLEFFPNISDATFLAFL